MNITLRSFFNNIVQFKAELKNSHKSINPNNEFNKIKFKIKTAQ
jgi:hypothetical protein